MTRIMTSDIRYIEAQRAYCRLVTTDAREFTLSLSLGVLERQLPPANIVRIHRSYLVNVLHVDQIGEQGLRSGTEQLPVSRGFREALLRGILVIGKG
jgi:DNA-binding LytR/AlgR family response regulator